MSTYLEVKAKADELYKQAEELKKAEIAQVILEIKEKMASYGITIADLQAKARKPSTIKYRSEKGDSWSGQGRMPKWMQEQIAAGKSKEDFLVDQ